MDDYNIVKLWKYAIIGFIAVIVLGIGSCQMTNYRIAEAIKAGGDPIAVTCALGGSTPSYICSVVAAREEK